MLAAALLTGIFSTTPMAAYADGDYDDDDHHDDDGKDNGDYSGTMTEQEIKQSNEGAVVQLTSTVQRTTLIPHPHSMFKYVER